MNDKFCQSCAMPLNQGIDHRATEVDGTKSSKYCSYCYSQGNFLNPNMTYEDMLQKGLNGISNAPGNKFKKLIMKKSYPMLLKKCERWTNVK